MPSPHTTAGYPDLVSDVDIMFQAKLETYADRRVRGLYSREEWTNGDPKKMTFQTYALPSRGRRRTELEKPKKLSATMGVQLEKQFVAYSGAIDVTDYMLKFDREQLADQMSSQLLDAATRNFDEELIHQILTYADLENYQPFDVGYTTSFTTPDGKAPGASDHTVPGKPGSTFSNILTDEDPLTPDALTELISQCQRNCVDDAGTIVPVTHDMLVVHNYFDIVKRATEILKTPNVPYVFENTVNVFEGGEMNGQPMKLVVLGEGAVARDGTWADGNQNDGAGVTAAARQFYWSVMSSQLLGANKYAIAGAPEITKGAPIESGLYSVWGNLFGCFGITRWQGKGYSFAQSL